jgi:hypothetical protein
MGVRPLDFLPVSAIPHPKITDFLTQKIHTFPRRQTNKIDVPLYKILERMGALLTLLPPTLSERRSNMEPIKVVLRFADGTILKGYVRHLDPHRPTFRFQVDAEGTFFHEMQVDGLKALFLVKSFEGDPNYRERNEYVEGNMLCKSKAEVTFRDGEIMTGWIVGYHPEQPGFFLRPADSQGNNILVLAGSSAVKSLRHL